MNTKNKISSIVLYVSLLAFISFVVYILYINQEVFYTAHDRSEFIFGAPFFHTLLSKPFGLMQYAGAWLTQLFCRPAFGSAVLAAIWVLIFLVGIKAFRLQGSASALMLLPVACLDLCLNHQRLLVLTVGRLSHHAAASVGGPLHPAQMASGLVSDWRLSLSGTWLVRPALRAVSGGCRKAHLAGVLCDCPVDLYCRYLAYTILFEPEGRRCRHGRFAPFHHPE